MDWPESGPYQRDLLSGAHRRAEQAGMNLLVLPGSVLRSDGAFPSWSLGDQERPLDGLIIATATIVGPEGPGWLVERLAQRTLPVVSVGEVLPGAASVLVENGEAFSQLLDHLLVDHGYRDPVLVTGLLTSFDARERLRVFREALARHGIADDGRRVVDGDFQFSGGREAIRTLWSRPGPRPDVVVCSNDNMAFGALHELSLRGIRVPEDVALTGFDDIEFSPFFESPVTTIRQPLAELAARAVDLVLERIDGGTAEGGDALPTVGVIRGSCGCPHPGPPDPVGRHLANQLWQYERTDASLVLDGLLSQLSAAYQEEGRFSDLVPLESRVLEALGLGWWYLCTGDPAETPLVPRRLHVASPEGALFDGPPHRFPGPLVLDQRWTALQVDLTVGPRSPRQFGALIVEYHERSQGRFELLRARLSEAVEAMLATQHLKGLNRALEEAGRRLEELSITDEMTGCPNRRGFLTLGAREIASCRRMGAGFWVIYLDLDGLKAINDRWGHEAGDEAIVGFAGVLKTSIRATDLMARLGGDEFLLLAPHAVDAAEAVLRHRIGHQLEAFHRRSPTPWRLACSLGGVYSPPGDTRDLAELMALADARLYEEKSKKKAAPHG